MINPQQETFCQVYTTKGETFGNAYKSYAEAYGIDIPRDNENKIDYKSGEYAVAQNGGSRLLLKNDIQARIKAILLERFNDVSFADARIQEIIENGKDTDAIQAIKVLNDLKGRITKKLDVTTQGRPLAHVSDEELLKLAGE